MFVHEGIVRRKAPDHGLFDFEPLPNGEDLDPDWMSRANGLYDLIEAGGPGLIAAAEQAVAEFSDQPEMYQLGALAALVEQRPEVCLRFLKRQGRRWFQTPAEVLLEALAAGQQRRWAAATGLLARHGLDRPADAAFALHIGGGRLWRWLTAAIQQVSRESQRALEPTRARRPEPGPPPTPRGEATAAVAPAKQQAARPDPALEPLSPPALTLPVQLSLPPIADLLAARSSAAHADAGWFDLRRRCAHLSLLVSFDELLCLPHLSGVATFWYQLATVRKVLKQFHGRVLLADEVGLGKTIEAGMVLKEYLLRGMVERVLVLTPASLVGQWREEMASKFAIDFATTEEAALRRDPQAFWSQPRVLASIATARRNEHADILRRISWDMIIVDEAHHLKSRSTAAFKLVNSLSKRFLLLLSATPVQNTLVELYNVLTLLKPGIFKTEREFREVFMTPGKPRQPANRDRLRALMRDVMIRNTRALVDLRLPPRHAATVRLDASSEEAACYRDLSRLVAEACALEPRRSFSLRHLLTAAGSSPAAAAAALENLAADGETGACRPLARRYRAIADGAKDQALLGLLRRNPDEKKMVFANHHATLDHLAALLAAEGMPAERYDGTLSGPEKDAAVARFRDQVHVLLCSPSGGEGRNLQFCNTLINFDLPWNPMAIEQRIGRLHRIGQQREVFVFNFAVRGTLEEHVLRILDEKIHMFELVVGEVDEILGNLGEEHDFAELVFATWVNAHESEREQAFAELGERVAAAKREYEAVKSLDENLFGDELEAG
jgi:superfamily II DNA or RNA helicase